MISGRRKIAVVAAGAVGAAGLAAGAIAATSGTSNDANDLAAAINKRAGTDITGADVQGAYLDVLKSHLADAVKAGKITQDQADAILKRAQSAPGLVPLGPGGRGFDGDHHGPRVEVLAPVATWLGMTEDQLRTRLQKGDTLTEIAKDKGKTRDELITELKDVLTKAGVPAAQVADMAAHIADDSGHGPGPGGPGRGGWGHGPGGSSNGYPGGYANP